MPQNSQEKILVIKLSALGDFVQALGPMKAIKNHHPNAHITLLTTKMFVPFGERCGYFDEVWIDERPKALQISKWRTLKKKLNSGGFTRVYDLQNNDRTSFYLKLFPKRRRPEWVGAAKGASHRNNSPERIAGHALDGHKQTLALAGIENVEIDDLSWVNEDLSQFNLQKPFILFVPGSAPQHPQKRWPADQYAALADYLSDQKFQVVLLGTDAERDITDKIAASSNDTINLTGQTSLFQIAALAHQAAGAVGNDTGPMHMIGPTGCKTLTLFSGHSTPSRHAPKGENVHTLQADNISDLDIEMVRKKLSEIL
ncbi:MAG: glycosyltransferase family 9 protein [Alcanivorax sp.]